MQAPSQFASNCCLLGVNNDVISHYGSAAVAGFLLTWKVMEIRGGEERGQGTLFISPKRQGIIF